MADKKQIEGSKLLEVVQAAAISPADAKALVEGRRKGFRPRYASETPEEYDAHRADAVTDMVIARYAKLSAVSGGLTGLAGVVPGIGTIAAMVGGATADAAVCMKLQVDMCYCLAETYGYDLGTEDARHLAFLIAAGGTLEHAGAEWGARLAGQAGVRMLRQYLKGAALQAVKEFFKRLGIVFTRKALEKALPFGIGVVIGASANYGLTRYVGKQAKEWFVIDRSTPPEPEVEANVAAG